MTKPAGQQPSTTPQAYQPESSGIISRIVEGLKSILAEPFHYAYAQLLSLNNTTVNIPVTVTVPITLEIQNAQICASVASSGGQNCTQLVLNPTQTAFTPVNIDLASGATPTISTASATQPLTTTSPTASSPSTTSPTNTSQSTSPSTSTSSGGSNNQTTSSTDNTNTQPSGSSSGSDTTSSGSSGGSTNP